MSSSTKAPDRVPTAIAVSLVADRIHIELADGRELRVPIEWFEWLTSASEDQRRDLRIIERGEGIWWDQIDEGLSVPALLGVPHS